MVSVEFSVGPAPGRPDCQSSVPYACGMEGYHTFRIPAVIATWRGTLLAFAEGRHDCAADTGNIDLVLRRSQDGGRTWGPIIVVADNGGDTVGNPAPVIDPRTGHLVLLSCTNAGDLTEEQILRGQATAEQTRRVFVQRSTDDGLTWSTPREITAWVKRPEWRWYATGPGHAIALRHRRHRGRLLVPANHSVAPPRGSGDTGSEPRHHGGHGLYSDDGGHAWQVGYVDNDPDGYLNVNESTLAELPNGQVYLNARNEQGTAPATRADACSPDGGTTLERPFQPQRTLTGPMVQGSVLQMDHGPLLFAGPADPSRRAAMTLRASTDDGVTWRPVHEVSQAPAAYCDLVQLDHNTVGLLYETGTTDPYESITFTRIPQSSVNINT